MYVLDLMRRAFIGSEKAYSLLKKLDFKREVIEKFHICLELVTNPSAVLDLLSDISAATLGDGSIVTFTGALDELQKLADTKNLSRKHSEYSNYGNNQIWLDKHHP